MGHVCKDHELRGYLDQVSAGAVESRAVPSDIARHATDAAVRALQGEAWNDLLRLRARSYFWAVVRRSVARDFLAPELSARFVLSTVAADLTAAGRSPSGVWDELVRGWADKVPPGVLEEYRELLCA